jgi:O-antigen/teichoic acid export membrane protein
MNEIRLSSRMKDVVKISSGTVIGQVVSVFTLPFITRLYGAEIMGIWAIIYAISSIVVTFCDLGLTNTIMLGDSHDEVHIVYRVISTLTIILCLLSGMVLFNCYYFLWHKGLQYSLNIAVFVLIYGFALRQVQTCYTWLNREKQYSVLMNNPIINYSVVAIVSIVLGIVGFKKQGYFWGVTLGQIITLFHMKRYLPRENFIFKLNVYKAIFVKHKEFIKYQMPTAIIVQLRQQIPNLLIGSFFGDTMLGYFSVSQKLLSIPVTFIGQSLGKVFYQAIAEMKRNGKDISEFVYKNLKRAMQLGFIPMMLLAAFGDAAIVIFFGKEYGVAGTISRIFVFISFFTFVSTATQGLDIVLNKQKYAMLTCFFQTLLTALSIMVGYYYFSSIYICTLLMTLTFIIVQVMYFCKMFQVMEYPTIKYLINIGISIFSILICSIALRYFFIYFANIIKLPLLHYFGY